MNNEKKTNDIFRSRKINVIFMLIATAAFVFWIPFSLREGSVPLLIAGIVVYGLCYIAHIIISVRYWRCPHCAHRFPIQWHPVVEAKMYCCPACGKRLKW